MLAINVLLALPRALIASSELAISALGFTPLMLVRGRQRAGAGATAALLLEAGADADMEPTMPPGATALILGFYSVGLPDLPAATTGGSEFSAGAGRPRVLDLREEGALIEGRPL